MRLMLRPHRLYCGKRISESPAVQGFWRSPLERAAHNRVDLSEGMVIINTMASKRTMSELLREGLSEAESIRAVAKATGLRHSSLLRFLSGKQSLRLDLADKLAAHFGIECRRIRKGR